MPAQVRRLISIAVVAILLLAFDHFFFHAVRVTESIIRTPFR